jgi:glutamine---fructose-6-phosphate transaminase (isomerizing)
MRQTFRMLDFIREQPDAVANTLRSVQAQIPQLRATIESRGFDQVIVAGLGSSYTASQMASPLLRYCLAAPVFVTVATEMGLDAGLKLGPRSLVVLVSRSGERAGMVDAMTTAKAAGATCVAVTAAESSLLAEAADVVVVTSEGPESAYAKTKSVMATAAALMQLGVGLDLAGSQASGRLATALANVPQLLATSIEDAERQIGPVSEWLAGHRMALVTGSVGNQGVAMEAALKFQEAAGVVTEWDETGSALHGAVTILDPAWLYVGLVTRADQELHQRVLRLAGQFGAGRLCVTEPGVILEEDIEAITRVPDAGDSLIAPLLFLPPVQLLTYQFALARGRNPDEPPFADVMLEAMLPPGRSEPDWPVVTTDGSQR